MLSPNLDKLKNRVIESSELDQQHRLRPLLLFKGSQSEGRIRSLWNLLIANMDADVPSVTEAVKLARHADFRHLCGLHANPQNMTFGSIVSRVLIRKDVANIVPGLWEYARHLAHSTGGHWYNLDPIPEYALRVRSNRDWRIMPGHLRPARPARPALPEFYPYISGNASEDHALLLAVDAAVPKGLPNAVRCDVCQDMIVAILSGQTTLDNLRADTGKYLREFWKMFPDKYGHLSLDGVVPGTDKMQWADKLNARTSRLTVKPE